MSLERARIRIALDSATGRAINDSITGSTPDFWRGEDLQIEFAVFYNGALEAVDNFAEVIVQLKPLDDRTAAPLMAKTVAVFDDTLTLEEWNTGAGQHFVCTFDSNETNLAMAGATSKGFWLVVGCITDAGKRITLGAGQVNINEDGWTGELDPAPTDSVRILGGVLQLRANDGLWYDLKLIREDGVTTIEPGQNGVV